MYASSLHNGDSNMSIRHFITRTTLSPFAFDIFPKSYMLSELLMSSNESTRSQSFCVNYDFKHLVFDKDCNLGYT